MSYELISVPIAVREHVVARMIAAGDCEHEDCAGHEPHEQDEADEVDCGFHISSMFLSGKLSPLLDWRLAILGLKKSWMSTSSQSNAILTASSFDIPFSFARLSCNRPL